MPFMITIDKGNDGHSPRSKMIIIGGIFIMKRSIAIVAAAVLAMGCTYRMRKQRTGDHCSGHRGSNYSSRGCRD